MKPVLPVLALCALVAAPVFAQERSPPERQALVDLAYAIGESHGLRQVCNGDGDQHWRDRMAELINTEAADADFEARLKQSFNSGFAARQSQFPSCGPESRKAELAVARKGEALSRRLANAVRTVKRMGPDDPALKDPENPDGPPAE
ncbi:MAG: TIGR02301 family protein [Caulobacter sp.]|nr:TIGR02301 family protein [Caulobacter sp.]